SGSLGHTGFVARLSNDVTKLSQATYLGGSGGDDVAYAVAADASGNVFVVGATDSNNFPGTTGGAQPGYGGNYDSFVAKLNNGLTTLTAATYLGGSEFDGAYALALNASSAVFVAGETFSS